MKKGSYRDIHFRNTSLVVRCAHCGKTNRIIIGMITMNNNEGSNVDAESQERQLPTAKAGGLP